MRALAWAVAAAFAVASSAHAQSEEAPLTSEERVELARVAAEAGRFEEARDYLRSALSADPRAATAFNLALVLESTTELLAARALYDQLLAGDFGELPDDKLARASERRTALSGQIATLRVTVEGAQRVDVTVDGQERGEARASASPLRVEVDPGRHTVRGVRADGTDATLELDVGRGEVRTVTLELAQPDPSAARMAPATTAPETSADELPSSGVSPWVWIGVGAAAVVAGVVLAIVLSTQPSEAQLPDGFLGSVTALRF